MLSLAMQKARSTKHVLAIPQAKTSDYDGHATAIRDLIFTCIVDYPTHMPLKKRANPRTGVEPVFVALLALPVTDIFFGVQKMKKDLKYWSIKSVCGSRAHYSTQHRRTRVVIMFSPSTDTKGDVYPAIEHPSNGK